MNRNSKKGFTIVELIIVIAVIAVLAAVLIPTFSNLIQKANEAKDTALVSNLNKGLKMSSKDFATMHEALQAVEENVGVNVEKISAVATDSKILWDSVNNCFVYLKSGDTKPTYIPDSQKTPIDDDKQYKYWEIVETARNDAIYSQYLAGDNHTEAVTVNTGFDAGKNANLVSVTYTNTESQSVVIRTNGGELVVDAGNATVAHYGAANYVNIKNVYKDSFHEHGVAAVVRIEQGHFVAEATAKVINLNVASSDVKITETDGAKVVGYSKASDDVTVTVNGTAKDVTDVKTAEEVKTEVEKSAVVAEGGVAEIDGIQFKSLQSAFDTAKDGQAVKLIRDIETFATIHINKSIVFDLNGHKLYNESVSLDGVNGEVALLAIDGSSVAVCNVVLKDSSTSQQGAIVVKENDCYAINITGGAKVTVESGNYTGNVSTFQVKIGELTILGGKFDLRQIWPSVGNGYEYEINCIDGNFAKGTAVVTIKGGVFVGFNPSNNLAESGHPSFLAEGYTVTSVPHTTNPNVAVYTVKAN